MKKIFLLFLSLSLNGCLAAKNNSNYNNLKNNKTIWLKKSFERKKVYVKGDYSIEQSTIEIECNNELIVRSFFSNKKTYQTVCENFPITVICEEKKNSIICNLNFSANHKNISLKLY